MQTLPIPVPTPSQPKMTLSAESARRTIYEAIVDAFNAAQQPVTRELIHDVTGIKLGTIDEQLDKLIEEEKSVVRIKRGFFQPVVVFPETRVISKTHLPNGGVKIEVGDDYLNLTPCENRLLGSFFCGPNAFYEAEALATNRVLVAQQAVTIAQLNRTLNGVVKRLQALTGESPQLSLTLTADSHALSVPCLSI